MLRRKFSITIDPNPKPWTIKDGFSEEEIKVLLENGNKGPPMVTTGMQYSLEEIYDMKIIEESIELSLDLIFLMHTAIIKTPLGKYKVLHRDDGPALETKNGYCEYYYKGLLHRLDGPAVTFQESKEYYINDNFYPDKESYEDALIKNIYK